MFSDFLNNIYGMFFNPESTIEKLSESPNIPQSIVLVLFLSVFMNIVFFGVGESVFGFFFYSICSTASAFLSWLLIAGFYELVSNIFVQKSHYKPLLCLFAFSMLPWVFVAPLELLKNGGIAGSLVGTYLEFAIWIWTGVLMFISIRKIYGLKFLRAFAFLFLPFIAGFISFNIFVSSIINLAKIFS